MTDSTKELFDAPWEVNNRTYPFDVTESDGFWVCECSTLETANRISRLPELYDELERMVKQVCRSSCAQSRPCETPCYAVAGAIELLQEVRDGK